MRNRFKLLILPYACAGLSLLPAQEFQLAPPQTNIGVFQSPIFKDSTLAGLRFDLAGAEIRYTLDGSLPGKASHVYRTPLLIRESCLLTAVAMHPEYRTSEPLKIQFTRAFPEFEPLETFLAQDADPRYRGGGAPALTDLDKGHFDLENGRWLGFEGADLDLTLILKRKERPAAVAVSTLAATGSWIFPPRRIEVWESRHPKRGFRRIAGVDLSEPDRAVNEEKIYTLPLPRRKARYWRVVVRNYGALPDWHPGKGKPAWLFVDEILLQR